ncbi:MAG: 5'/3'-nucleotidase SurE [Candidatus Dormibacteraceae bacterium]
MGMNKAPRILVTNDDGITAPGLHALYMALAALGEVTIVAPDAERSAVGHAITTMTPLRIKKVSLEGGTSGYAVNGTPADCVRLAILTICDTPPDLVVSGINLGPNTATNVIYSGTVSAATEARILRIPSIAVSLATFKDPIWETPAAFARQLAADVLAHGLPDKVLLNINVPNISLDKVKGTRVTRQGESGYNERYEMRSDPRAVPYYWQAGTYQMSDDDEETDALAVDQGYVSITPVSFDLTAHESLPEIRRRFSKD